MLYQLSYTPSSLESTIKYKVYNEPWFETRKVKSAHSVYGSWFSRTQAYNNHIINTNVIQVSTIYCTYVRKDECYVPS